MKTDERHKCVIIPIVKSETGTRFLTVRDKRFKEWTFITGGCRKREIPEPIKCAMRELDEETMGVFSIKEDIYKYFTFSTKIRSPEELERDKKEGLDVTCIYHVYTFLMNISDVQQLKFKTNFAIERRKMDDRRRMKLPVKRANDENDDLAFDTYAGFRRKTVWPFIISSVIAHPEFEKLLTTFFVK